MQLPKFLCCSIIFPSHIKEIEVTKITASVIVPYHLFWKKKNMINNWNFCCRHSPTNCPVSLKIVLFKENLRKLWPALPGKLIIGFQKCWKQCFWVCYFKNVLGGMPPDSPRKLAPLVLTRWPSAPKTLASGTLRNMSTTLKTCWKPS